MFEDCIFIDFDGVILDTETRLFERKHKAGFLDHDSEDEFYKYFEYTLAHPEEWDYIIREADSLNNSVEIIKELEKLKEKIVILTKIHTFYEMKVKIDDLRNHRHIESPVCFVPPGVEKHEVVIPRKQILIDDHFDNIERWVDNGGIGYLFDRDLLKNEKHKVKSLEFLIDKR